MKVYLYIEYEDNEGIEEIQVFKEESKAIEAVKKFNDSRRLIMDNRSHAILGERDLIE